MICYDCSVIPEPADFKCKVCGVHIEDYICEDSNGVELPDYTFKYCPNCGTPVSMEEKAISGENAYACT